MAGNRARAIVVRRPLRAGHPMIWLRLPTVLVLATAVLLPLGIIVYQSFLDEPFFVPAARWSLSSYQFILGEPDFYRAFSTSLWLAAGMTAIALPLGGILAFLLVRTDLPGKAWIEPVLLVPIVLSPIVIAFGYVVAIGPVGFATLAVKQAVGFVPWNLYSLGSLIVIAGLSHVPHVYLFSAASLRKLNAELEDSARVMGAPPWRVALTVSLPMAWPALVYSAVLIFFLGFELFGLPLIIGDPANVLVLTTYLFKLTNILGTPSYQLMAVVVVAIGVMTLPLVYLQRYLLRMTERYVALGGKGARSRPLRLGKWRWVVLSGIVVWLVVTVVLPLSGVLLRAFVSRWGEGLNPFAALTLQNFHDLAQYPNLLRGVFNTFLLASLGGAAAVAVYALIALATHRWNSRLVAVVDYLVLLPRAMPGLVAGLAFLWVFLFVPYLGVMRSSLIGIWLAYSTVWLAFGLRLISAALAQVGRELEEAARVSGADPGRALRDVTLPLIRFGLMSSWLLCFMVFVREYSTGVYLQGPGTEVLGPLIVSLFGGGALELVAALSVANVVLVAAGLGIALRFGVRM
jgi:iron(III) transport system permease protein